MEVKCIMKLIRSCIVSFSMYSKIPMPQFKWNDDDMRNAELEVLKGQRSGRTYRKPHSKATYTASAPGEPPARRTGNLRMHWNGQVKSEGSTAGGGDRKSTRLNSSHTDSSRMPSSA